MTFKELTDVFPMSIAIEVHEYDNELPLYEGRNDQYHSFDDREVMEADVMHDGLYVVMVEED